MADRRMFHKNVVESDAFLDMPTSAQALYFHIGMYADDDGFVNGPRRIARLIGASNEDLRMLVESRFLLEFPNGVVVIKHWRMANSMKNDRAKMPQYPELAASVYIKGNRSYTDHPAEGAVSLLEYKSNFLESKRNPNGIQPESKRNPNGIPVEGNRSEGKRTEQNRTELNAVEEEPSEFFDDDEESTEFSTAAAAREHELKFLGGELGKGVVLLSDKQIGDLLDTLGLDAFDHYVSKLANFIIRNDATVKSHYETILKWWREDIGVH